MKPQQQKKFADYGLYSHWNWREKLEQQREPIYATEIQLFSDAHFTGSRIEHGAYVVMNAQPFTSEFQLMYARLILRFENYLDANQDKTDLFWRTDTTRYHGGTASDEMASLYSLCYGVRIRAGGVIRTFGPWNESCKYGEPRTPQPNETPIFSPPHNDNYILPWHSDNKHLSQIQEQIESYVLLTPQQAVELVRAARLYQDAVWLAENNPETSWLLLVSAIEVASNYWYRNEKISDDLGEQLKHFSPKLFQELNSLENNGAKAVEITSKHLKNLMGSTKKFREFLVNFSPKEPPTKRPISSQIDWEEEPMTKIFNKIYKLRSIALHSGIPFPKFMCMSPRLDCENNIPYERPDVGIAASAYGASWKAEDLPIHLHIFEYIVRHSLLNWWNSMIEEVASDQAL